MSGEMLGKEFGEAPEFVGRVVEAGDQERDDFQPEAHVMNAADAVEDGGDASAEFVVVAVVETLEVDFVEIEPWDACIRALAACRYRWRRIR